MEQALPILLALVVGMAAATLVTLRRKEGAPSGPGQALARLEGELYAQSAEVRRLADSLRSADDGRSRIGADLSAARRLVEELSLRDEERRSRDHEVHEAVRRISTVLAGGGKKGRAGENLLRDQLAALPPGMLETDFRVNGKTVEFALRLPDGSRLPVDSKWSGDAELEALEAAEDPAELAAISREIERIVAMRAKEVAAYLDPGMTSSMAVAAIPDPAYRAISKAHAYAYARNVIIVPYSTALPVLLFLFSLVSRYGDAGDVTAALTDLANLLAHIEGVVENKIARGNTMIQNGAEEIRLDLGKAQGTIVKARAVSEDKAPEQVELRAVE